jgi:transcriptional regulator with XRE-family HTH domain
MEQLTKQDTILWINHAITYYKSIDKTQKDMAKALGIEESRVSEMKGGNGVISPNLMTKIVKYCGAPKRNPGRYEEVELYDDLDSFFDNFKGVTVNRFHRKLLKLAKNEEFYQQLLSLISTPDLHYKTDKKIIESQLNELFLSEEYLEKCNNYSEVLRNTVGYDERPIENFQWWNIDDRGLHILSVAGIVIGDFDTFRLLYLFSKLFEAKLGFKFCGESPLNVHPKVSTEPVILTGKRILIIKSGSLKNAGVNTTVSEMFGNNVNHNKLNEYRGLKLKPEQYMPDCWEEARCELYLSEDMNYHFLLQLSPRIIAEWVPIDEESQSDLAYFGHVLPNDRLIVIRNINALSLYQQIEDVRKWFGLPSDSLFELKQEIAKAGGYVPGARVLL